VPSADEKQIKYADYKYLLQSENKYRTNLEMRDLALRKVHYVTKEVIMDLGISKNSLIGWIRTNLMVLVVLFIRMIIHYLG